MDDAAIFVFESPQPSSVVVYPHLDWARESLENLDVAGDGYELAFTATGHVVKVEPTENLFAEFEVTDQIDLERLKTLLQRVRGPAHLANDPSAYAQEWMRREDLDAQRPPILQRVWAWCRSRGRTTP